MAEWVWFAGSERLKHLALMRASAASRRFAQRNLVLLAVVLGLLQATQVGWKWVSGGSAMNLVQAGRPSGLGWLLVAAIPPELLVEVSSPTPTALWWNPIQAAAGIGTGTLLAVALLWLVLVSVRGGTRLALTAPYRDEQRMTAAIHYSTAWSLPIVVAVLVAALTPISHIGEMARWQWYPPEKGFILSAAVVAGLGVALWWFWLIRLGATAPALTRARVVAFLGVGASGIAIAAVLTWRLGLGPIDEGLFQLMRLS